MEVINNVSTVNNNAAITTQIVKYGDKTFKLTAQLRNGGNTLKAELMDRDGVFQFVLGSADVDFTYACSYVSDQSNKRIDLSNAIIALKKVIKKVY